MTKNLRTFLVRIAAASGWLTLVAGCDIPTNPALPGDLALFIQRFAGEALAAFLL